MNFPIEMYKIRLENMTIKVPCERCAGRGIVDYGCHKCGGNGVHKKTINVWKVSPKKEEIVKIDRSSKDSFYASTQTSYKGGLRYWTGLSEFYNEEDKYLHFTKEDAQQECDARNNEIEDVLKIINSNKTKQNKNNELEKLLELEKAKSAFWKLKAQGEEPVLCGSYESIKYITS